MNNYQLKAVYFTDLQIENYKAFNVGKQRLENCLRVLDDVYEYADRNEISVLLFGGDLYDSQKALRTVVVNHTVKKFSELAKKYPEIICLAITGNHDQDEKSILGNEAGSALEHIQTLIPENFYILDNDAQKIGETAIFGIPYYEYGEHFRKRLEEQSEIAAKHKARGMKTILMIHQTPSGLANLNIPTDTNVDDPLYDAFDFVWCGHIHAKQMITPKFVLGGSPLHRDLGDEGQDKGFWLQDLNNPTDVNFLSLRGSYPEYVRVRGIVPDKFAGDFVVVESDVDALPEKAVEEIKNFSAHLTAAELLTNYWKQVDGKDNDLLEVGLTFI